LIIKTKKKGKNKIFTHTIKFNKMEREVRFQNVDTGFFLDAFSEFENSVSARPENGSAYQNWHLECDPNGVRIRNAHDGSYLLQGFGILDHSLITSLSNEPKEIPEKREIWNLYANELIVNFETNQVLTCNKDGSVELCCLVEFYKGSPVFNASQRWFLSCQQCFSDSS
jgi:hypothetical protein